MRNDVNTYIKKIDIEERKKNCFINKCEDKIKKYEKELIDIARKEYNNEYLILLKKEVEARGLDYEKVAMQEIIEEANSKELSVELIRKIVDKANMYGKDIYIKGNDTFLCRGGKGSK